MQFHALACLSALVLTLGTSFSVNAKTSSKRKPDSFSSNQIIGQRVVLEYSMDSVTFNKCLENWQTMKTPDVIEKEEPGFFSWLFLGKDAKTTVTKSSRVQLSYCYVVTRPESEIYETVVRIKGQSRHPNPTYDSFTYNVRKELEGATYTVGFIVHPTNVYIGVNPPFKNAENARFLIESAIQDLKSSARFGIETIDFR